jgi:hypothetical protein
MNHRKQDSAVVTVALLVAAVVLGLPVWLWGPAPQPEVQAAPMAQSASPPAHQQWWKLIPKNGDIYSKVSDCKDRFSSDWGSPSPAQAVEDEWHYNSEIAQLEDHGDTVVVVSGRPGDQFHNIYYRTEAACLQGKAEEARKAHALDKYR